MAREGFTAMGSTVSPLTLRQLVLTVAATSPTCAPTRGIGGRQ